MKAECSYKAKDFCDGKQLRSVLMKIKGGPGGNVYGGLPVLVCSGCRNLLNGSFKYVTS